MTTKSKMYEKVAVRLTDADMIKAGEELAEKRLEYNAVDAEKSEALANFNAKLKTLDGEIDDLARQVDDRERAVDIEIREEPDDGRNLIAIVRADTGHIIRTRAMTLNEMAEKTARQQGTLPLGDPDQDAGTIPDPDDEPAAEAKANGAAKAPKPPAASKRKRANADDAP